MDSIFIATLLFIFVTALVGTYIQRRSRDLCLNDFTGFNVTIEMNDGKCVWGRLNVFFNSVELLYPTPHQTQRDISRPVLFCIKATWRAYGQFTVIMTSCPKRIKDGGFEKLSELLLLNSGVLCVEVSGVF